MGKNIIVIPPKKKEKIKDDIIVKKRMAAYCRVSSGKEEQLASYEAQMKYYKNYYKNHKEYSFAGLYADEAISGTRTKNREQFNKMIEDCKKRKIDVIITKSISRFARNTLDTLNFVRFFKTKVLLLLI